MTATPPALVAVRLRRVKEAGHTMSLTELARELKISTRAVTRYRRMARIQKPQTSAGLPPLEERLAHAQLLVDMGENVTTISTLCRLHPDTVADRFPEAVWTREQRNEATGLMLKLRRLQVGPLTWPAETDDREEDR